MAPGVSLPVGPGSRGACSFLGAQESFCVAASPRKGLISSLGRHSGDFNTYQNTNRSQRAFPLPLPRCRFSSSCSCSTADCSCRRLCYGAGISRGLSRQAAGKGGTTWFLHPFGGSGASRRLRGCRVSKADGNNATSEKCGLGAGGGKKVIREAALSKITYEQLHQARAKSRPAQHLLPDGGWYRVSAEECPKAGGL